MKKIKKLTLNQLEGKKMSHDELKFIVGGYNFTDCCGSGCVSIYTASDHTWVGCVSIMASSNDFCCYG